MLTNRVGGEVRKLSSKISYKNFESCRMFEEHQRGANGSASRALFMTSEATAHIQILAIRRSELRPLTVISTLPKH
jgi:hypothetical protein